MTHFLEQHYLSSDQWTADQILEFFKETLLLEKEQLWTQKPLDGKILLSVFLEPSTRTRLSFEAAMHKMGGSVISITSTQSSSLSKGESLADTARMFSINSDIVVMRAPEKGMVSKVALGASVPVINAGDGIGEHPTQQLLDLYTIWKSKKTLTGLKVGLMGDNKHSRVLRGVAKMLSLFGAKLYCINPPELSFDEEIIAFLNKNNCDFSFHEELGEVIDELDVLQVNRIRKEYLTKPEQIEHLQRAFVISKEMLINAPEDLMILDPLPRVNTILPEVDELPHAYYFQAVQNGLYIRMNLLKKLLKT